MKRLFTFWLIFFICHAAYADPSGLPGLEEAITSIIILVCMAFLLGAVLIGSLVFIGLNVISKTKKKNIFLPSLGAFVLSGFVFWIHGIGDLTYSTGYCVLIILSAIIGAIIGYLLTPNRLEL